MQPLNSPLTLVSSTAVAPNRRQLVPAALERISSFGGDWSVLLNEMGRIVHERGSCRAVFGGPKDVSSIGRHIVSFVHPLDMTLATDMMEQSLSALGSQVAFDIRAGLGDGVWTRVEILAVNCFDDPGLNGIILRVARSEQVREVRQPHPEGCPWSGA